MKIILAILMFTTFLFACSGDCLSCHPKLANQNEQLTKAHEKLDTCKKCHSAKSLENVDMGQASCGQDCWECHSMKKVSNSNVKQHGVLATCNECHKNPIQNFMKTLQKKPKFTTSFLK